jgi:hypothetical protein
MNEPGQSQGTGFLKRIESLLRLALAHAAQGSRALAAALVYDQGQNVAPIGPLGTVAFSIPLTAVYVNPGGIFTPPQRVRIWATAGVTFTTAADSATMQLTAAGVPFGPIMPIVASAGDTTTDAVSMCFDVTNVAANVPANFGFQIVCPGGGAHTVTLPAGQASVVAQQVATL